MTILYSGVLFGSPCIAPKCSWFDAAGACAIILTWSHCEVYRLGYWSCVAVDLVGGLTVQLGPFSVSHQRNCTFALLMSRLCTDGDVWLWVSWRRAANLVTDVVDVLTRYKLHVTDCVCSTTVTTSLHTYSDAVVKLLQRIQGGPKNWHPLFCTAF